MATTLSEDIYFINGKKEYLFNTDKYYGFLRVKVLVYPSNRVILNEFNQTYECYCGYGSELEDRVEELGPSNPKDWVIIKHIVYHREGISVYGQIELNSPTLGLKCYKYKFVFDNLDCYMEMFEGIHAKEFKSTVHQYIK
jgi:hypothetical protein